MREVTYLYIPEEEMNQMSGRLSKGLGRFEIVEITYGKAKSSDNMQFVVDFKVWDSFGNEGVKKDYFPQIKSCIFKWIAFLNSIGEKYESNGKINLDSIIGKTGSCELVSDQFTGKDGLQKEGVKIGRYLPPSANDLKLKNSDDNGVIDDDIPF